MASQLAQAWFSLRLDRTRRMRAPVWLRALPTPFPPCSPGENKPQGQPRFGEWKTRHHLLRGVHENDRMAVMFLDTKNKDEKEE